MFDILTLLQCLLLEIKATTMGQLNQIIIAMLAISGRVTILGISRWTGLITVIPLTTNRTTSLGRVYNASTAVEPS